MDILENENIISKEEIILEDGNMSEEENTPKENIVSEWIIKKVPSITLGSKPGPNFQLKPKMVAGSASLLNLLTRIEAQTTYTAMMTDTLVNMIDELEIQPEEEE